MTKTIGERLKEARKKSGMTQEQVANKAKCDKMTLANYENDRCSPTLDIIASIAKVMDVSIDYLVWGDKNV